MLNINTNVVRSTKNFNADEVRLIIGENENAENEFKVNVIGKKTNRRLETKNCDQKRFDRETIDLKNDETLSKLDGRNLRLTKLFL